MKIWKANRLHRGVVLGGCSLFRPEQWPPTEAPPPARQPGPSMAPTQRTDRVCRDRQRHVGHVQKKDHRRPRRKNTLPDIARRFEWATRKCSGKSRRRTRGCPRRARGGRSHAIHLPATHEGWGGERGRERIFYIRRTRRANRNVVFTHQIGTARWREETPEGRPRSAAVKRIRYGSCPSRFGTSMRRMGEKLAGAKCPPGPGQFVRCL